MQLHLGFSEKQTKIQRHYFEESFQDIVSYEFGDSQNVIIGIVESQFGFSMDPSSDYVDVPLRNELDEDLGTVSVYGYIADEKIIPKSVSIGDLVRTVEVEQ